MQTPDQLVEYARQIAIYRGYGNLENGLQPLDVLQVKLEHEQQEFAEAVVSKDIWRQYHEAADILYYAACAAEQNDYYKLTKDPILVYVRQYGIIRAAGLKHYNAEKAALAKYGWRSAAPENADPANKNEEFEIELIKKTVQAS